jgi:hypothetical protein
MEQRLLNDPSKPTIGEPTNERSPIKQAVGFGKRSRRARRSPGVRALVRRRVKCPCSPAISDGEDTVRRQAPRKAKRDKVGAPGNVEVRKVAAAEETVHGYHDARRAMTVRVYSTTPGLLPQVPGAD